MLMLPVMPSRAFGAFEDGQATGERAPRNVEDVAADAIEDVDVDVDVAEEPLEPGVAARSDRPAVDHNPFMFDHQLMFDNSFGSAFFEAFAAAPAFVQRGTGYGPSFAMLHVGMELGLSAPASAFDNYTGLACPPTAQGAKRKTAVESSVHVIRRPRRGSAAGAGICKLESFGCHRQNFQLIT